MTDGPERARLRSYLSGAKFDATDAAGKNWRLCGQVLEETANALRKGATKVREGDGKNGGLSGVTADAVLAAFQASAESMQEKGTRLVDGRRHPPRHRTRDGQRPGGGGRHGRPQPAGALHPTHPQPRLHAHAGGDPGRGQQAPGGQPGARGLQHRPGPAGGRGRAVDAEARRRLPRRHPADEGDPRSARPDRAAAVGAQRPDGSLPATDRTAGPRHPDPTDPSGPGDAGPDGPGQAGQAGQGPDKPDPTKPDPTKPEPTRPEPTKPQPTWPEKPDPQPDAATRSPHRPTRRTTCRERPARSRARRRAASPTTPRRARLRPARPPEDRPAA